MKTVVNMLLIMIGINYDIFSQHLPLAIGNEWHYNQGLGPVRPNISLAVDTITIHNKKYFKIERKDISNPFFDATTYDRIESDSLYYRIYGATEELVFNFNWQNHQVITTPWMYDTTCLMIEIISRDTCTIWGINTEYFSPNTGFLCPATSTDTAWVLSSYSYLKYFGALDASDGLLIGAKINGVTYGNLHPPIPVELMSFSNEVIGNSVKLNWSTTTETNNYGFEIMRSIFPDINESFKVGFVKGSGTISKKIDYEFWNKNLRQGDYKYQLIQIDFNGTRKQIAETEARITNPNSYALYQNYPNPFNPTTNIDFSIPQKSKVTLSIYNTLGQIVSTLINEEKEAGIYQLKFNASTLSSGVYFYKISAGEFNQTKKLILLK